MLMTKDEFVPDFAEDVESVDDHEGGRDVEQHGGAGLDESGVVSPDDAGAGEGERLEQVEVLHTGAAGEGAVEGDDAEAPLEARGGVQNWSKIQ